MAVELNGKRLDLMKTLLPAVSRVTLLTNPIHPGEHLEVANPSGLRGRSASRSSTFRCERLRSLIRRFAR